MRPFSAARYSRNLPNFGSVCRISYAFFPSPSSKAPKSFLIANSALARNGATAASAIDHSPTAYPSAGRSTWMASIPCRRLSRLSPLVAEACHAGMNLDENISMKKRALARRTGSLGRRTLEVEISAINSIRTRDSASLWDSEEGWSGGAFGPPYTTAGT